MSTFQHISNLDLVSTASARVLPILLFGVAAILVQIFDHVLSLKVLNFFSLSGATT